MSTKPRVKEFRDFTNEKRLWIGFNCPGCGGWHSVPVEGNNKWQYNNDPINPTLSPSLLVTSPNLRCHFFVKNGTIQFLSDSQHSLANQTVTMSAFEEA